MQSLPVMTTTKMIQDGPITVYFPLVYGLADQFVEYKINQEIIHKVYALIDDQIGEDVSQLTEMIGLYEVKTNERDILSLTFSNYTYMYHAAHGLTLLDSLTFNMKTGKSFSLKELFKPDSNYVEVLSPLVQDQITKRDIPTLEPFTKIQPNQSFYIADKSLVLYFQLYELTAYAYGFPMFPISVYDIQDIIQEDGPLGLMAMSP